MQKTSLPSLARKELASALAASSGRSSTTIYGGEGHALRQTLIALRGGERLAEHANPGEVTVQVLEGRVRLVSGGDSWGGGIGDLLVVPEATHSLEADEDSVVLMTVVTSA